MQKLFNQARAAIGQQPLDFLKLLLPLKSVYVYVSVPEPIDSYSREMSLYELKQMMQFSSLFFIYMALAFSNMDR